MTTRSSTQPAAQSAARLESPSLDQVAAPSPTHPGAPGAVDAPVEGGSGSGGHRAGSGTRAPSRRPTPSGPGTRARRDTAGAPTAAGRSTHTQSCGASAAGRQDGAAGNSRAQGAATDRQQGRSVGSPGGNRHALGRGPLATAEDAFAVLCVGPRPLGLTAHELGLPGGTRVITMTAIRDFMLTVPSHNTVDDNAIDPDASHQDGGAADPGQVSDLRERVWSVVVGRAQAGDSRWVLAAVGLALPGLAAVVNRLAGKAATSSRGRLYRGSADHADLEADVLTGFLTALRIHREPGAGTAARLCWAAYRAAASVQEREAAYSGVVTPLPESAAPAMPWGHPDVVLARAVTDGVLTPYEAELIGRTRLERVTLRDLAEQWRIPVHKLGPDRTAAETRLVAHLQPHRSPNSTRSTTTRSTTTA